MLLGSQNVNRSRRRAAGGEVALNASLSRRTRAASLHQNGAGEDLL
jgi:hypothetical protein